MESIEIYCDGSVSRQVMDDTLRAHSSDYVGRIAVVIPDLDYGLIERFYDSLVLPNGHENSLQAETNAIRRAEVVSTSMKNVNREFIIFSDNPAAIEITPLANARLIPPQAPHYADAFLKKMLSRSNYLRRSERKVVNRKPTSPRQIEIARLMMVESIEFRLSESPLFQSFKCT